MFDMRVVARPNPNSRLVVCKGCKAVLEIVVKDLGSKLVVSKFDVADVETYPATKCPDCEYVTTIDASDIPENWKWQGNKVLEKVESW